jgi:hypothetical protein
MSSILQTLTLLGLLEERRTRFRAELCELLIRGKKGACRGDCSWGKTRSEEYGRLLAEYTPIKMLNTPMADVITKMEQVSTEDMGRTSYSNIYGRCHHKPVPYRATLPGMLDALKKRNRICIDCVRNIGGTEM